MRNKFFFSGPGTLGRFINRFRKERIKISRQSLAENTQLTPQQIAHIENNANYLMSNAFKEMDALKLKLTISTIEDDYEMTCIDEVKLTFEKEISSRFNSKKEFCEKTGISYNTITTFLLGRANDIKSATFVKIANSLGKIFLVSEGDYAN
jgi:transcriptional regulator with XRE-family HTH domain